FSPPQKEPKSASIKLVLNHTKIVLHVRYFIKLKSKCSLSRSVSEFIEDIASLWHAKGTPFSRKRSMGTALCVLRKGKAPDIKTKI
ncbi:hypothetical protein, partial [Brachyspira hyodysenteriae]|uniref:hypothetical protein n=2 Tax=Brachyspira hyodysenteriae TaxID=159 RepID=UPI0019553EF7